MVEKGKMLFLIIFVVITSLTAVIVLLANVGIFGTEVRQSAFAKWGIGGVLGEIVTATIVAFKLEFFSTKSMLIVFDFKSPKAPGAKLIECSYEISDAKGERVDRGEKLKLTRGPTPGTWMFFIPLPSNIKYEHITTMVIKDDNGIEYPVTDIILQHTLEV
ncbi:MAG: hypothetical protein LUQ20_09705 [Candidatus Methanoperedens sp.]|jgi:hypothetical protein|nr:hypothetical protein [Candidatus Methanoperedens sp.]